MWTLHVHLVSVGFRPGSPASNNTVQKHSARSTGDSQSVSVNGCWSLRASLNRPLVQVVTLREPGTQKQVGSGK